MRPSRKPVEFTLREWGLPQLDLRAFSGTLSDFLDRTSSKNKGRLVHVRTQDNELCNDLAGYVDNDGDGKLAVSVSPSPEAPVSGACNPSKAPERILSRREREDERRASSWCQALPHDAVPGPLVAALLDEWLPPRCISVTSDQIINAADKLGFAHPQKKDIDLVLGGKFHPIHVESLILTNNGSLCCDVLRASAAHLPQLTALEITSISEMPLKLGKHLSLFPCLEKLVIESATLNNRTLQHIWGCTKLATIQIGLIDRAWGCIPDVSVEHVARCPALTNLKLCGFTALCSPARVLSAVGRSALHLASLAVSFHGLQFPSQRFMDCGATLPRLTKLRSVSFIGLQNSAEMMTNLASCPSIETARFENSTDLATEALARLLETPTLTTLALTGVKTLVGCSLAEALEMLQARASHPPALQHLDLANSSADVLDVFAAAHHCPGLVSITAKGCNDAVVRAAESHARRELALPASV